MKLHTPVEGSALFWARIVLVRRRSAAATAGEVKPGGLRQCNWPNVPAHLGPMEHPSSIRGPEKRCAEFTLMAGTGYIAALRFAAAVAFFWIPTKQKGTE